VPELPATLDALLGPDLTVSDPAAPLRLTRRVINGRDVYFVINDSPTLWQGTVTFGQPAPAAASLNLATGAITPLADPTRADLALDGWGAVVLRLSQAGRVSRLRPQAGPFGTTG
jgi:hypothetical protein